MSKETRKRHESDCQAAEAAFVIVGGKVSNVPPKKRKEDAKPTLYLNRI